MKFSDFVKGHESFISMANYQYDQNNITFKLLVRIWNSLALLYPEKCEDVWVYNPNNDSLELKDNPLNLKNEERTKQKNKEKSEQQT